MNHNIEMNAGRTPALRAALLTTHAFTPILTHRRSRRTAMCANGTITVLAVVACLLPPPVISQVTQAARSQAGTDARDTVFFPHIDLVAVRDMRSVPAVDVVSGWHVHTVVGTTG